MKSKVLILGLIVFSVSAFGVPDQYGYEYSINVSDVKVENGNLEQRQPQEYSEHLYGLTFKQNDTCAPITVEGSLTAPDSVGLVSVSGDQRLGNYEYQKEVRTDLAVDFNNKKKIGEMTHNSEIKSSGADGSSSLDFSGVGTNNTFEIEAEKIDRNCKSKTRTLGVTFRTYKFWDKFRINSIDAPEITKNQRFNITVNVTNPGNRPTAALLEEPNTIQARFTGLTYPVGSVKKDINLSAGETRIVKIPFSLPTNTEETRLTNRVDIEKKEPLVVQISNQRADIVERKINLTVKDGREPLENFNFRIKPEKPYPGETFKLEIFTPEDKSITPDGKIQFIKDGEVLEEWKTSRLSSTTNFPSWEELNRTELDNITIKVTLNELNGKVSESKRIQIADSKSGWLNAAYSLLFSGDWFIFG